MRKLSIVLSLALLLTFLVYSIPYVSAVEPHAEWAEPSYWENLDFDELSTSTWESALVWLEAEADLSLLIFIGQRADGFFGSDIGNVLAKRFLSNPDDLLYALVNEEPNTQKHLIFSIVYGTSDWDSLARKLESVTLSGPEAEKGYEILEYMIAYAEEEEYNTEITNPKTGDPVGVAAVLLAVSALGSSLLLVKKRSLPFLS